ncbi:hypothetical protein C8039_04020 [Halogeometricum sp. wsp3]|nr:hypothetical protein C8039_04020 [Halogeometricum sp. wsp3]
MSIIKPTDAWFGDSYDRWARQRLNAAKRDIDIPTPRRLRHLRLTRSRALQEIRIAHEVTPATVVQPGDRTDITVDRNTGALQAAISRNRRAQHLDTDDADGHRPCWRDANDGVSTLRSAKTGPATNGRRERVGNVTGDSGGLPIPALPSIGVPNPLSPWPDGIVGTVLGELPGVAVGLYGVSKRWRSISATK